MVMDPLSAFALACNVIQMVEVGYNVLSTASEYRSSADGATAEHRELKEVARTLNNLGTTLRSSLEGSSTTDQASAEAARLNEANNECVRLSGMFIEFVDRLKVGGRHATLASLRMSVKASWYKSKIEVLHKSLSEARNNLNIAFLLYIQSQQVIALKEANATAGASAAKLQQNVVSALETSSGSIQDEIRRLAESLKETYLDSDRQAATTFVQSHEEMLANIHTKLALLVEQQQANHQIVSKSQSSRAQHVIMDNLSFSHISKREDQVHVAHKATYRWLLQPQSEDQQKWTCFGSWIQSSNSSADLYWIHGKPGSGKSTLLKYLDSNASVREELTLWAAPKTLVMLKFYFWSAGVSLQTSLEGFYRSTLFQLMEAFPYLIEHCVSTSIWRSAQNLGSCSIEWTNTELQSTLGRLLSLATRESKIFFSIDGLDEMDENDEARYELIDFVLGYAATDNVKICLTSRPLNIFRDAFGHLPQLRLEDLTYQDIEMYTTDKLSKNPRWRQLLVYDRQLGGGLVRKIVRRAEGVFLWVYLVLGEMLRGLRDGDSMMQLNDKLDMLPKDLDTFFERIIDSISPAYRTEASKLLQLASRQETEYMSIRGLTLLDATFIEETDEGFALQPGYKFRSDLFQNSSKLDLLMDSTARKVNSRCPGLLEFVSVNFKMDLADNVGFNGLSQVLKQLRDEQAMPSDGVRSDASDASDHVVVLGGIEIKLIHRSLRDFLLTSKTKSFLHRYTNGPMNVRRFTYNARLVQLIGFVSAGIYADEVFLLASSVLSAISVERACPESAIAANLIASSILRLAENLPLEEEVQNTYYIIPSLDAWHQEKSNMLTMAIDFRLTAYVLPSLSPQNIKFKRGRPILDYILRPRFATGDDDHFKIGNCFPDPDFIRAALASGADPNEMYDEAGASVWALFLCHFVDLLDKMTDYPWIAFVFLQYVKALEIMIEAGACTILPESQLSVVTTYQCYFSPFVNEPWKNAKDRLNDRWPYARPISTTAPQKEPMFDVADLLDKLPTDFSDPSGHEAYKILASIVRDLKHRT